MTDNLFTHSDETLSGFFYAGEAIVAIAVVSFIAAIASIEWWLPMALEFLSAR